MAWKSWALTAAALVIGLVLWRLFFVVEVSGKLELSDLPYSRELTRTELKGLKKAFIRAPWQDYEWDHEQYRVTLYFAGGQKLLLVDRHGWLINPQMGSLPPDAALSRRVAQWHQVLAADIYGRQLAAGATAWVPGEAQLLDLDTGLVQVVYVDREYNIFPQIQLPELKSRFRAVVAVGGGERLAAALSEDRLCFAPGEDLLCAMLIHKAAGNFLPWYSGLTAAEATRVHLGALAEGDFWALSRTVDDFNASRWRYAHARLQGLEIVALVPVGDEIMVDLELKLADGRQLRAEFTLPIMWDREYWLVQAIWLDQLLDLVAEVR